MAIIKKVTTTTYMKVNSSKNRMNSRPNGRMRVNNFDTNMSQAFNQLTSLLMNIGVNPSTVGSDVQSVLHGKNTKNMSIYPNTYIARYNVAVVEIRNPRNRKAVCIIIDRNDMNMPIMFVEDNLLSLEQIDNENMIDWIETKVPSSLGTSFMIYYRDSLL